MEYDKMMKAMNTRAVTTHTFVERETSTRRIFLQPPGRKISYMQTEIPQSILRIFIQNWREFI
jgi:hypothetical protein